MIDLRVGRMPTKSPDTAAADADFVRDLVSKDNRFTRLVEEFADQCTSDWAGSRTLEERERAFTKLQGAREFVKFLQVVVERGTPVRGAAGPRR